MAFAIGVGLTITVAVVVDEQPPADAVIVNIVVCVTFVLLVNVPEMVPVPLAGIPVRFTVLSLIQVSIVPETALGFVITILVIGNPEHFV